MKNILKQTSYIFFAQTLTRIIGFFYVIYLARVLGVSDFGLYTVALAYFSIISSFADFGFNRFLIREVARDRLQANQLVWNIVILRLTLTSVLFAIFSITLYSLDPDKMRVSLALLATLAILPQSIALTFDAIFVAFRKLQFSAIALFIASLTTAISGFLLVGGGFGSIGAVNALIFGQIIYAVVLILFLYKVEDWHFAKISLGVIKKATLGSLPYGILGMIGLVSFKIDTPMISYFRGNFETGIYGAAYKFLDAIVFIPAILAAATFPIFAKSFISDLQNAKRLYFNSIKIMFFAGIAMTLIFLFILPEIFRYILPNYLPSVRILKILSFSIPLIFMHIISNQALLSTDKYLKHMLVMYLGLFSIYLVLYFVFIPVYGAVGAAWVTVVSEILTFLTFYFYITTSVFKRK